MRSRGGGRGWSPAPFRGGIPGQMALSAGLDWVPGGCWRWILSLLTHTLPKVAFQPFLKADYWQGEHI